MKLNTAERTAQMLQDIGLETIRELETEKGILASGKEEIYGCIFGRDSLITSLKLLKTYQKTGDTYYLSLVKKILLNLVELQGRETNIESGEEPGKIIHEYREKNHEHLTGREERPWHLCEDGTMRNYDSVDSTPLFLMAVSKYVEVSGNAEFLDEVMPAARAALGWLLSNLEEHICGFASYSFSPDRKCGGLATQSWMDSHDSVFFEDGSSVLYPIAPVEAQGYFYIAMKRWSRMLSGRDQAFSLELERRAEALKSEFNKHFIHNREGFQIAFALDGAGRPMFSLRSSPGHLMWISLSIRPGEYNDSVLEPVFIPKVVAALMSHEIFKPEAGVRTLTEKSVRFNPASYHNGSIWPHDNAIISEGMADFGYEQQAADVRNALRKAWGFFGTPIELYTYIDEEGINEYSSCGQKGCLKQAWSAASMLSEL